MPYKDIQKKALYQRNYMREYMRNKRASSKSNKQVVKTLEYDADGNAIYDENGETGGWCGYHKWG